MAVSADAERKSFGYRESRRNGLEMREDKVVGVGAGFET
jgi:hypothetical protein